jgi:hypothetical protein
MQSVLCSALNGVDCCFVYARRVCLSTWLSAICLSVRFSAWPCVPSSDHPDPPPLDIIGHGVRISTSQLTQDRTAVEAETEMEIAEEGVGHG